MSEDTTVESPFSFNLWGEKWVPVIFLNGEADELKLLDVLLRAHEIREVRDQSPLVTVAVIRLLLAILYRCWEPPSGGNWDDETWEEHWLTLWKAESFPAVSITTYADKWRTSFDLFDKERPFFQIANAEVVQEKDYTAAEKKQGVKGKQIIPNPDANLRLIADAPDGGGPLLFDHRNFVNPPPLYPAFAARFLLAAHAFGSSASQTGRIRVGSGLAQDPKGRMQGILFRGAIVWLGGESLFQTLMLNLIPSFEHGKVWSEDLPCWEQKDIFALMAASWKTPRRPTGLCERYTWQGRMIRLVPELDPQGNTIVRWLHYTEGFKMHRDSDEDAGGRKERPDEPMKAHNLVDNKGWTVVDIRRERASWRDLYALGMFITNPDKPSIALRHMSALVAERQLDRKYQVGINVVGMATDRAKIFLWRHDRVNLSPAILTDTGLLERLTLLSKEVEEVSTELLWISRPPKGNPKGGGRTWGLCRLYLAPESDDTNARQPDPKDVDHLATDIDPRPAYWARLEHHFYELLADLPDDIEKASDNWRNAVEREAGRALKEACAALGFASDSRSSIRAIAAMARIPFAFSCGDFEAAKVRRKRTSQPDQPETLADAVQVESEEIVQSETLTSENGDAEDE